MKKVINQNVIKKQSQKKYNVPIIGHFANKSIRFDSINQASIILNTHYHLIFEAAIGKIQKAAGAKWEYENGTHWLKYKAHYIRQQQNYKRLTGFNG